MTARIPHTTLIDPSWQGAFAEPDWWAEVRAEMQQIASAPLTKAIEEAKGEKE